MALPTEGETSSSQTSGPSPTDFLTTAETPELAPKIALKHGLLIFQCSLAIFGLWFLIERANVGEVSRALLGLDLGKVVLVELLLVIQIFAVAERLRSIFRYLSAPCSFRTALTASWIGAFVAQTPLSSLGADATKILLLRKNGALFPQALTGVSLDRIYGTLVLLLAVGSLLAPLGMLTTDTSLQTSMLIAVGIGVVGFAVLVLMMHMPSLLREWPLMNWLAELAASAWNVYRNKSVFWKVFGLSVLAHALGFAAMGVVARGLGVPISIWQVIILTPFPIFLSHLPISIGGWGVREAAVIVAFRIIGVPEAQSLAVSIIYGACVLFASLPGGLLWLLDLRLKPPSA